MRYVWKCQCGYEVEVERKVADRDISPSETEEDDDHYYNCIGPKWERIISTQSIAVKGFSAKNGYSKGDK